LEDPSKMVYSKLVLGLGCGLLGADAYAPGTHAALRPAKVRLATPAMNARRQHLGAALGALGALASVPAARADSPASPWAYSTFLDAIEAGQVEKVSFAADGKQALAIDKDGNRHEALVLPEQTPELVKILTKKNVVFAVQSPPANDGALLGALGNLAFPLLLIGGLFFLQSRGGAGGGMGGMGGGGGPLGMGKSKSKIQMEPQTGVTFADVAGCDGSKLELTEIVEFLKNPGKYSALGAKIPRGAVMEGPPGTGKTLLARAVAGEAGVPFFYMSGSEFEEVFVGVGAKRVRELFSAAKKRSPCIIFIDEIDAIGSHRNPKEQQAMKMTLNQLLVEMDGFTQNTGVIVLAATNFPEALDRALVRPGRFDTNVVVPLPDVGGRRAVLELYTKPVPLDTDVEIEVIARATPGFSGADLSNLVNVAALHASHLEKKRVGMADLEYACDKIRMGAERKSAVISPENLKVTAYHEGGHALVALHTAGSQPIHKATIVPRGNALGMVSYLPEKDQLNLSREQMLAHLDICMGGRVAEELIFGKENVTTGASSDLAQATSTARNMIIKYGMSDALGPVYHGDGDLSRLSSAGREAVEAEVKRLCTAADANARRILTDHADQLHRLADGLLEFETLSPDDIRAILAGRPPACAAAKAKAPADAASSSEAAPAAPAKEKPVRKAGIFSRKVDQ